MKKFILSFAFFITSFTNFSQHLGSMDREVFNSLNVVERSLLTDCVNYLGLNIDSMDWIQVGDSTYEKVRMDDGINYFYNKKTVIFNSDNTSHVVDNYGKNQLNKPKFLVAIFKYTNDVTRVTLMMYY